MDIILEWIKATFPDSKEAIILIVFIIFFFWMYKEVRASYIENNKATSQRIDKAIDSYSELELEIYKFLNDKSNAILVIEKMSKASSIMTYELLNKCNKYKIENDAEKRSLLLQELHSNIKNEIVSLKRKQTDPVSFKSDGDKTVIENYIKIKIAPFVVPFGEAYFNLVLLIVAVLFSITLIAEPTVERRILYLSLLIVMVMYVLFIQLIIGTIILKKRFKHSGLNWFLFALFVVLPLIFIFLGPWYRGIILLVFMIAYLIYASKKSITKRAP